MLGPQMNLWPEYYSLRKHEFFTKKFLSILEELNSNVKSHNEILEGNYFYHHNSADLTAHPDPSRKEKRIRLGKSN